jgi:hypothetical protein
MGTSNLKSAAITNLDASPPVANTKGNGGPGSVQLVDGYVTAVASDAAGSTYKLCRVPSNCYVKRLTLASEAQGAGKINLSVYYSSSANDGTQPSLQGIIVPTTGDQFFASDIDLASAVNPTDVTNESGNYTPDKRAKRLWDALGLTSDPGGFFDIVAVVHTTAITTGTGKIYLAAEYII